MKKHSDTTASSAPKHSTSTASSSAGSAETAQSPSAMSNDGFETIPLDESPLPNYAYHVDDVELIVRMAQAVYGLTGHQFLLKGSDGQNPWRVYESPNERVAMLEALLPLVAVRRPEGVLSPSQVPYLKPVDYYLNARGHASYRRALANHRTSPSASRRWYGLTEMRLLTEVYTRSYLDVQVLDLLGTNVDQPAFAKRLQAGFEQAIVRRDQTFANGALTINKLVILVQLAHDKFAYLFLDYTQTPQPTIYYFDPKEPTIPAAITTFFQHRDPAYPVVHLGVRQMESTDQSEAGVWLVETLRGWLAGADGPNALESSCRETHLKQLDTLHREGRGSALSSQDVFDELLPILMAQKSARARLFCPLMEEGQLYVWVVECQKDKMNHLTVTISCDFLNELPLRESFLQAHAEKIRQGIRSRLAQYKRTRVFPCRLPFIN